MNRENPDHSTLYLPDKPDPTLVAHELVHVLQHLYEVRNMCFGLESEHGAYIMQYAMGKILGYTWVKSRGPESYTRKTVLLRRRGRITSRVTEAVMRDGAGWGIDGGTVLIEGNGG
jgi:hypothetical protein